MRSRLCSRKRDCGWVRPLRGTSRLCRRSPASRRLPRRPLANVGNAPPELLAKTVGDLELSVRSRKALQRLNINTLGELASRTEDELLGCKNFGHTSLNEIKQQLTSFGLGLRKLDAQ
jgi:DNA-directed RNA polymerase subunit alpha